MIMRQACDSNKEKLKIKFHANKRIARTSRDGELIGYRRDNIIVGNTLSYLSYDLFIFLNKYKTILKAPPS